MARRRMVEQQAPKIDMSLSESAAAIVDVRKRDRSLPFTSMPELRDGYARIKETVFFLPSPEAEYNELEADLKLGTREFDNISAALDRSEDNARRAHKLYVNARVDYERFMLDAELVEASMWDEAVAALQAEKVGGQRTKAITEADTKYKCQALFPDEWRDLQMRKIEGRKMLEHLERFADLWRARCFSLAKQLEARR